MAGRAASGVVTRYAGVQVQTSAFGVNVPLGWGTFRCKCNLVWYNNFQSQAQKAQGGKGGSVTTGYSYTADLILAICEGPIDSVITVYVNGNIYSNGSKTALAQANLNISLGAVGQPVWSYLTTKYPTQALGYSGLAIVYQSNYALDSGATPPNHSFEVVKAASFGPITTPSGVDCDPSVIVADFFQNTRTGVPGWISGLLDPVSLAQYQDYCLAAGLVVSPIIDQQRSASDFLRELFLATNSTAVWSEGLLKFIPYGDTALTGNGKTYTPPGAPVYSLNDDDFIPKSKDAAPITSDIEDQSNAYNVIQLEYLDRTNQYNMAIALASDAANVEQYGMRRKDPDTVHMICDPGVAAISAQLFLQRTLYIRAQYKFTLGWMFALLEPGDIVEITDPGLGLVNYPVRIIQVDEDEKYSLAIIAEDYPVGISNTPLYTMQAGNGHHINQSIDPGGVEANLALYSDSPANAAWTKTNVTITADTTTDQYGLSLASTMTTNTSAGVHGVSQSITTFAGLNYVGAVCVQANALNNYRLTLSDGSGNGAYLEFNAATGAILTPPTAIGTGLVVNGGVSPTLASGIWQAVLCVQVPTATALVLELDVNSPANANSWTPGSALAAGYVSQFQIRQGVAIGVYAATQGTADGPLVFNPPSALNATSQVWAAVAGGPNWGGANVWLSIDGTDYQLVGTIGAPARYGSATTSFASHADPDTTDSLGLDLGPSAGALTGATQATADNGGTLCLLGAELICYEVATLTNPSRYTLGTYIRRGYLNTTIAAHSIGETFVRLDDAIFDFPYFATNVGQTVYVKFASFNAWGLAAVPLQDCVAYAVVPQPLASAAPVAGSWTVTGTTLTSGGVAVPVIQVTGAIENPSATATLFYLRTHGSSPWTASGVQPQSATTVDLTSVVSGGAYDVGIAYMINGVLTPITIIGSNITAGTAALPNGNVTGLGALALLNTANTPQIVNGAVSNVTSAYSATPVSVPGSGSTTLISMSVTTTGGPVILSGCTSVGAGTNNFPNMGLYRNGTLITQQYATGGASPGGIDTPAAGTYTYSLVATPTNSNGCSWADNFLSATELKR